MEAEVVEVEKHRAALENCLKQLLAGIGEVQIGKPGQFPYGWRKAAKVVRSGGCWKKSFHKIWRRRPAL
jgi:hypothetical protein